MLLGLFLFRWFNSILPSDVAFENALLRQANQHWLGPVGLRGEAPAVARPLANFHRGYKGIRKLSQIAQDHVIIVIHDVCGERPLQVNIGTLHKN